MTGIQYPYFFNTFRNLEYKLGKLNNKCFESNVGHEHSEK